jgi:hypothetical protein
MLTKVKLMNLGIREDIEKLRAQSTPDAVAEGLGDLFGVRGGLRLNPSAQPEAPLLNVQGIFGGQAMREWERQMQADRARCGSTPRAGALHSEHAPDQSFAFAPKRAASLHAFGYAACLRRSAIMASAIL